VVVVGWEVKGTWNERKGEKESKNREGDRAPPPRTLKLSATSDVAAAMFIMVIIACRPTVLLDSSLAPILPACVWRPSHYQAAGIIFCSFAGKKFAGFFAGRLPAVGRRERKF